MKFSLEIGPQSTLENLPPVKDVYITMLPGGDYKETAAKSLKLTATDMSNLGLVDEIIQEPLGGAHAFPEKTFQKVKRTILTAIDELKKIEKEKLIFNRMEKFSKMGFIKE